MAWGDPKVEIHRKEKQPAQTRPGGRIFRSLKRFLISLSITLNIIFISLLIAGYFFIKNSKKSGGFSNLQNVRSVEDLSLPDNVKNSELLKKLVEMQDQNIKVINELSGEGETGRK